MREVRASQLVSAVVLRTFLSLIPLLVTAIGVVGFVAARQHGGEELSTRLIRQLKLSGDLARLLEENLESAQRSRTASSVIGLVSLVFSGTAVFGAVAEMCDACWQVPARGLRDRALGFVWLIGAGITVAASALATAAIGLIPVPGLDWVVGVAGATAMGAALFWWTQFVLTNVRIPPRSFIPGALVGGVALAAFQLFGTFVVARLVSQAGALYASLAAVIALITFLSLFAWILAISVVVNVLRWEDEHGSVALTIRAPSLPAGVWTQAERGGQRPSIKPPGGLLRRVRRLAPTSPKFGRGSATEKLGDQPYSQR